MPTQADTPDASNAVLIAKYYVISFHYLQPRVRNKRQQGGSERLTAVACLNQNTRGAIRLLSMSGKCRLEQTGETKI